VIQPAHATTAPEPSAGPPIEANGKPAHLVARNMAALVVAQFITTPMSVLVNAVLGRKLGASDFGAIYLVTTMLAVGFLLVEWGGLGQVAAEVARNRSAAPSIFGTGLALRVLLVLGLLACLGPFAALMGYDPVVRMALWLCAIRLGITSLGSLCNSVIRGFERLRWHAFAAIFGSLIDAALVIPTLLLGGDLRAALTAQIIGASVTLLVQISLVIRLKIGKPRLSRGAVGMLLGGGFGFLVLDVILKLQPYIDAAFLAALAPSTTMGWYGAANRMVGVLIFPATTLTYALYPTLARLWTTDRPMYDSMVRLGLRSVMVLGILAASGTILFADLIVWLVYGGAKFGPTADDLRILSGYVLLVYTNIVLSAGIASAGRQLRWAAAQSLCLLVSVALDPLLIPWFQANAGNGSLGVCVSVVVAETAMVLFGLRIVPRSGLDRSLLRTLVRCIVAAMAMGATGLALRSVPLIAVPATVAVYLGVLWKMGETDPDMIELVRSAIGRKIAPPSLPAA